MKEVGRYEGIRDNNMNLWIVKGGMKEVGRYEGIRDNNMTLWIVERGAFMRIAHLDHLANLVRT